MPELGEASGRRGRCAVVPAGARLRRQEQPVGRLDEGDVAARPAGAVSGRRSRRKGPGPRPRRRGASGRRAAGRPRERHHPPARGSRRSPTRASWNATRNPPAFHSTDHPARRTGYRRPQIGASRGIQNLPDGSEQPGRSAHGQSGVEDDPGEAARPVMASRAARGSNTIGQRWQAPRTASSVKARLDSPFGIRKTRFVGPESAARRPSEGASPNGTASSTILWP